MSISALMQQNAEAAVVGWVDRQPPELIWITAVTVFEVHFGLELLDALDGGDDSSRRRSPAPWMRISRAGSSPFEQNAARAAALIAARQRRQGRSIEIRDASDRRASPRPAARPSPPATPATSPTSGSPSSTPGSRPE